MISVLDRWTTPLGLDAYLSTFSPLWGTQLRGVVEEVRPLTATAAAVTIRTGRAWTGHVPGQFVTVGVEVDGVLHHRCFSITSLPSDRRRIELTVQARDGGLVSQHLVHHASPGEVVRLRPAAGEFTLPPRLRRPLLFVTGGSGITPVAAILRDLVATGRRSDAVLLHHARTRDRLLFADELDAWAAGPGVRVVTTLTGEGGSHLSPERLDRECPDWRHRDVYVCGPAPLVEAVVDHWSSAGLADRVHVERFDAAPLGIPTGTPDLGASPAGGTACFRTSGVTVEAPAGRPLLDVAEDAGLQPAHGCRMGICHTCTTRLESGCATDLRNGRRLDAGAHVQLCVTAAAGDVTLDL